MIGALVGLTLMILWFGFWYFYVMAESKTKGYRYELYWHSSVPGYDKYKFKESYKCRSYARSMLIASGAAGVGYSKLVDTKTGLTLICPPSDTPLNRSLKEAIDALEEG